MNKTSYFPSRFHENVFAIGIAALFFLLWLKICTRNIDNPKGDVLTTIGGTATWLPDTIPQSKVQYFLKLPYTQDQFRKKIDTIYQVTMQLGKSMTVDQSEQLKGFVLSVIGRLSNDAKIDSIKLK